MAITSLNLSTSSSPSVTSYYGVICLDLTKKKPPPLFRQILVENSGRRTQRAVQLLRPLQWESGVFERPTKAREQPLGRSTTR